MITLENGNIQGANGLPIVPFGYIELYLNGDATIIASPHGQVLGGTTNAVRYYFDGNCNLIQPALIWSNQELNPQNDEGLGTCYVVNFYDDNGTRLNNAPMIWVFPEVAGSTVDISTMVSVTTTRVYYPTPLYGTLTSETPEGTAPATTYTLSYTPTFIFGVYLNGQFVRPGGLDYTLAANRIIFNASTSQGDDVYAVYLY